MAIIKHCIICGNEISLKPSAAEHRTANYCSQKCYAKARKKFVINTCLQCNKEFEVPISYKHYKRFCSDECIEHYNNDLDKGIGKIKRTKNRWIKSNCKTCGREYWKWGEKGTIYCNSHCKPSPTFNLVCQYCNKEFTTKRKESKFCSVSCGSKYNSQKQGFGTKVHSNMFWDNNLNENERMEKRFLNCKKNKKSLYKSGFRDDLTHYVRSSWEANFARVLNYLNRNYEYEKQHFTLSNGTKYYPDFYDYKRNCFYEIKGFWKNGSQEKYNLFLSEYPHIKIKLIDAKQYFKIQKIFENKVEWEK